MDFSWAANYPDLYRTCTLFRLTEICNPIQYRYRTLKPIEQHGPQCGLVALAMCTDNPTADLIARLFQTAKDLQYTYNGEIFSAIEMVHLARDILPPHVQIELYAGSLATTSIKERLLNGHMILVPYDNGVNNAPCQSNGHKAHWAVISGAIQTDDEFYVTARHGATKHIGVWPLSDLALSNAQLFEFAPSRKLSGVTYKLPEGGIDGPLGLKCKAVLLSNL